MKWFRVFLFAAMSVFMLDAKAGTKADETPVIEVYKNAGCGCCGIWEEHLKKAGFTVKSQVVRDVSPLREKLGMPDAYASCHTAKIANYLIEGHVPAEDIRRLLREKPDARGLSAPGMPIGAPGMESDTPEDYEVLLITKDGKSRLFERHPARSARAETKGLKNLRKGNQ